MTLPDQQRSGNLGVPQNPWVLGLRGSKGMAGPRGLTGPGEPGSRDSRKAKGSRDSRDHWDRSEWKISSMPVRSVLHIELKEFLFFSPPT